jgi:hypothetical protein
MSDSHVFFYLNLPGRNFVLSLPRDVKQSVEYVLRNSEQFLSGGFLCDCGRVALEESLEFLTRDVGPLLPE